MDPDCPVKKVVWLTRCEEVVSVIVGNSCIGRCGGSVHVPSEMRPAYSLGLTAMTSHLY